MTNREGQFAASRTVLRHVIIGQPLAVASQAHDIDQHQMPNDRDLVGSCWRKVVLPVMPQVYPVDDARLGRNVTEALVGATVKAMEFERNAAENGRDAVVRRGQGSMTRYWVLGLILAFAALIFLARRIRTARKVPEDHVDIPLWEPEQYHHVDLQTDSTEDRDDTAPAVLSPPEWKTPRS